MIYRTLTKDGDYSFGNNEWDYTSDVNAIAQAVKTKILLFYGEWWENIGEGIPMFQSLIGQMNPEGLKISASLLLSKRIQEVEGVVSVDRIEVDTEGRTLNFTVDITTTSGQTTVEVNI